MKNSSNKYLSLQKLLVVILQGFKLFVISAIFTDAIIITAAESLPYIPQDAITIDCGSSRNSTAFDLRSWSGDVNSPFFPIQGRNEASIASAVLWSYTLEEDPVPHGTARLSHSEFTYTIPVSTPGPKFIRFHFYSDVYQYLDPSKAVFSVKVGRFTLLSNFSVFLSAHARGRKSIVKEFYVPIEKSIVNITFTPESSVSEAFVLINGIEVVSTPADLYFRDSDDGNHGHVLVGQDSFYYLKNDTSLETMYRINIGGKEVIPAEDTGIFRRWERDDIYLTIPGQSLGAASFISPHKFTAIPDYIAPVSVYETARTMGNDKEMNKKYNLTWEFPVDSGFYYMLRLHFCEILAEINNTGDRCFLIFISNETAELEADVIYWSGGKYVPYFRDYVVAMFGQNGENKLNLSLALEANPDDSLTLYSDAILNGAEIFKLNNSGGSLARPDSDLSPQVPQPTQQHVIQKHVRTTITVTFSGKAFGVLFLFIICLLILRACRKIRKMKNLSGSSEETICADLFHSRTPVSKQSAGVSSLPSDLCRNFSLAEIPAATNNFEDNSIGVGGFGHVYKGMINDGVTMVAVKRLKPRSSQGVQRVPDRDQMNLATSYADCGEEANEPSRVGPFLSSREKT